MPASPSAPPRFRALSWLTAPRLFPHSLIDGIRLWADSATPSGLTPSVYRARLLAWLPNSLIAFHLSPIPYIPLIPVSLQISCCFVPFVALSSTSPIPSSIPVNEPPQQSTP